jgi:MFS family permease
VSNSGNWLQNLAVPYVIFEVTDSAFWVGLATFSQFVPIMLLGPLGGSIADGHDRRRVLMVTQSLMAVAALLLWAVWVAGVRDEWALLALVALSGVLAGLNIPSWQAFVNDLVPRDDLLSAVTLNSLQFNAARAIGPGVAGVLLATLGPAWAFLLNAASFAFVLVALALVRTRPVVAQGGSTDEGVLRRFRAALRYSRRHTGIAVGITVVVLVGALGNPVFQFTVVFADDVFGVGAIGLGLLNVALGVGAVLAAPLVSGWDAVLSKGAITRWGLLAYGSAIAVFALAPTYAVGLVALVVVGAGFLAVVSATNTSTQYIVADHMRGRVMALRVMVFTGSFPLGALIQGWLADRIGPRATLAGAAALLVALSLVLGARRDLLVRLDDPHDESTPAGATA